jgi:hypothetical protein
LDKSKYLPIAYNATQSNSTVPLRWLHSQYSLYNLLSVCYCINYQDHYSTIYYHAIWLFFNLKVVEFKTSQSKISFYEKMRLCHLYGCLKESKHFQTIWYLLNTKLSIYLVCGVDSCDAVLWLLWKWYLVCGKSYGEDN